jgi:hypothetical protein
MKKVDSPNDCFDLCDNDKTRCAAATFTTANTGWDHNCFLMKYGFERNEEDEWTSYIKPEVKSELQKVPGSEPGVEANVRFTNHYLETDELTPTRCFRRCELELRCSAASFTVSNGAQLNCYFYRMGEFQTSVDDLPNWISFRKAKKIKTNTVRVEASSKTSKSPHPLNIANIVINNLVNNTFSNDDVHIEKSNIGNTNISKSKVKYKNSN